MKYYYSVDSLSSRVADRLNTFVLPFISLFAFISSLICVIVLISQRLKGIILKHILLESIANLIYAFVNSFFFLIRCGVYCAYGYNYYAKLYEYYVYIYVGKSLELFTILLDLNLCILRLYSFTKKRRNQPTNLNIKLKFLLFAIISFCVSIPAVMLPRWYNFVGFLVSNKTISANETRIQIESSLYVVSRSEFSNNEIFNYMSLVLFLAQGIALLLIIMIINIIILYKLKQFLNSKSTGRCK